MDKKCYVVAGLGPLGGNSGCWCFPVCGGRCPGPPNKVQPWAKHVSMIPESQAITKSHWYAIMWKESSHRCCLALCCSQMCVYSMWRRKNIMSLGRNLWDPSVWEELLYEAIYKLFEVYKSTGRKIFHKLKIFRTAANLPKGGQPPKICSFFFLAKNILQFWGILGSSIHWKW